MVGVVAVMERLIEQIGERRDSIYETLKRMDKNKNGTIGPGELHRALRELGIKPAEGDLRAVMRAFDKDNNKKIDYFEFYKVLRDYKRAVQADTESWPVSPVRRVSDGLLWEDDDAVRASVDALVEELYDRREYVLEMLERMDTNGTGYLSRAEMKRGLDKLGVRLGAGALSDVVRTCPCTHTIMQACPHSCTCIHTLAHSCMQRLSYACTHSCAHTRRCVPSTRTATGECRTASSSRC